MKISPLIFAILLLGKAVFSQGFVNLDFESAQVSGYAPGSNIPISNALPGWVGYSINPGNPTQSITEVYYEATTPFIGFPATIALQTTNNGTIPPVFLPIQGSYSVFLESQFFPPKVSRPYAAIGQTGEIPTDAKTLLFWGNFSGQVTFAGLAISYAAVETIPNNYIYAADISLLAGQTGKLLFSTTDNLFAATLDNIQFSPQPIPEPSAVALLAIGSLLLIVYRIRPMRNSLPADD